MNLEGSLDAFGLPDVVSLLASTGKSGASAACVGPTPRGARSRAWSGSATGRVCGATPTARARRSCAASSAPAPSTTPRCGRPWPAPCGGGVGVARALLEAGAVDPELMRQAATDQIVDAVFDLLRWPEGDFGFDQAMADLDDVGVLLDPADVLAEAQARGEAWSQLSALVPGLDVRARGSRRARTTTPR